MTYKTSKDYERLWELVQAGEQVVCFVDYDFRGGMPPRRDIAKARMNDYRIEIGVRGICYLDASRDNREEFIGNCVMDHVEFIDPADQFRDAAKKIWHSPEEVPDEEEQLVVRNTYGICMATYHNGKFIISSFYPHVEDADFIEKWAYVRDLEGLE